MGFIAAGLAVAAVGSGVSAYGASKNASASRKAAKNSAHDEQVFAVEQAAKLNELYSDKKKKLQDINGTLDRYGGGPTAGTKENLGLLRKAQNDFLKLGAGDFQSFSDQLADIQSATVANSFGAGSPAGTFTQLSAQNIAALRQQGLNSGLQIGGALANDTYNLLNTDFGLLDQRFNIQRDIEARRIGQESKYAQQAAATAGANYQAGGSFLQSTGSALTTYGTLLESRKTGAPFSKVDVNSGHVASDRPYAQPQAPAYTAPKINEYTPAPAQASYTPNYALPTSYSLPTELGYGVLPPKNLQATKILASYMDDEHDPYSGILY